jgi:hypothetical protein
MNPRFQIGDKVRLNGTGWGYELFDTVQTIVRVYDNGGGAFEQAGVPGVWYVWLEGHSEAHYGYTGVIEV